MQCSSVIRKVKEMVKLLLFTKVVLLIYTFGTLEADAIFFRTGRIFQPGNHPESRKYERWFTQNLDHFNPNDERTWQQRYFVNDKFASGKGNLAFLLIGGEGYARDEDMARGSWITYARQYKPILFQLEHRYYGKSHPTEYKLDGLYFIYICVCNVMLFISEFLKDVEDSVRANNIDCSSLKQVEVLLHTAVSQKNYFYMYIFFMQLVTKRTEYWLCSMLNHWDYSASVSEMNRLANILNSIFGIESLSFKYDTFISKSNRVNWNGNEQYNAARQWIYQTCTEFGYFQTSATIPLSSYIQTCQNDYKSSYNEMFVGHAINRTNVFYGGLDIEVSNVVFVHGSRDPWRLLGITKTLNDQAPAILIEGM
uniref:Serine protease K12H4.7 n=1 Tax=Diabrotica virgifera virgifera TaxID=50390 RepID=A0A6P7HD32_DIAVI